MTYPPSKSRSLSPSSHSRWSIDQRDKKPSSIARGRRSRGHRESDRDATRFGVPLKQHPTCMGLIKCSLNKQR